MTDCLFFWVLATCPFLKVDHLAVRDHKFIIVRLLPVLFIRPRPEAAFDEHPATLFPILYKVLCLCVIGDAVKVIRLPVLCIIPVHRDPEPGPVQCPVFLFFGTELRFPYKPSQKECLIDHLIPPLLRCSVPRTGNPCSCHWNRLTA